MKTVIYTLITWVDGLPLITGRETDPARALAWRNKLAGRAIRAAPLGERPGYGRKPAALP